MRKGLASQTSRTFSGLALAIAAAAFPTTRTLAVTSLSVSPSTYTLGDVATPVTVQANTAAAGNELTFDVCVDVDGDGTLDPYDPRFMSFSVADGQVGHLANASFWHDEDGATNSGVSATLIANGFWLFSGHFIVKVTDENATTRMASFTVEQDSSYPCVVTGQVELEGSAAGGAIVGIMDMAVEVMVSTDFADADGRFELRVESPGNYGVFPFQPGLVTRFDGGSGQMLEVSQGTNPLSAPLVLYPGNRTISGKVSASDTGEGFRGMLVNGESENGEVSLAVTDDDGNYSLPAVDGLWEIIPWTEDLSRLGYVTPYTWVSVSGSNATGIDLSCPKATTLVTGTVKDKDTGQGLQGYEVWADLEDHEAEAMGCSGPDGRYALGVIAGDWEIEVEEDTLVGTGYARPPRQLVTAPASGTVPDVDFLLQKGGRITGHVYEDDGVTPLPGAEVDVHEFGTWNWVGWRETLPDGSYSFSVPSGTYRVHAYGVEGWAEQYYDKASRWDEATAVVVSAPDETSGIDFVLQRAATITGHVYEHDGQTPIGEVGINVYDFVTSKWVTWTETLADGSYSVMVPSGTYTLHVFGACGWADQFSPMVTVTAPSETGGVSFVLQPGATIRGHVYEDDGVTPIAGAWVEAVGPTGGPMFAGSSAGHDGSYCLSVPSGSYKVEVFAPGWVSQYYDNAYFWAQATTITVTVPEERPGINFILQPEGTPAKISGHVYEQGGVTPMVGARVEVLDFWDGHTVAGDDTNAQGLYSISVSTGSYKVKAEADGWVTQYYFHTSSFNQATTVSITAPQERTGTDFVLLKASTIKGHVYRQDGATPIEGVSIAAYDYDTWDLMGQAETVSDGSYTLEIPAGKYYVEADAWRCNWQRYPSPVTVGEAAVVENIDFSLECTPFAIKTLPWSTVWAGGLELQWESWGNPTYRVLWSPGPLGAGMTWHEVPNAQDEFRREGNTLIWTDRGAAPGMNGSRPGDPDVRKRFYRVSEEPE